MAPTPDPNDNSQGLNAGLARYRAANPVPGQQPSPTPPLGGGGMPQGGPPNLGMPQPSLGGGSSTLAASLQSPQPAPGAPVGGVGAPGSMGNSQMQRPMGGGFGGRGGPRMPAPWMNRMQQSRPQMPQPGGASPQGMGGAPANRMGPIGQPINIPQGGGTSPQPGGMDTSSQAPSSGRMPAPWLMQGGSSGPVGGGGTGYAGGPDQGGLGSGGIAGGDANFAGGGGGDVGGGGGSTMSGPRYQTYGMQQPRSPNSLRPNSPDQDENRRTNTF